MGAIDSQPKLFRRFNAIDLVTIAVFAALVRAGWYIWQIFGFAFPFNVVIAAFFYGVGAIASAVIVRKAGAFSLFTIAASLINFFFQGEALVASILYLFLGVLADAYVYLRLKAGDDPFSNLRDMTIAGTLFSLLWSGSNWGYVFPIIFMIELNTGVHIGVAVACFAGGIVGGILGYLLGDRLKGLIY